jgi:hypothetical protein
LLDDIDGGRFPGLYLMITGTSAFFDGRQGVQLLPPLADRMRADFTGDPKFDNPRAPQIRLAGFTPGRLLLLGRNVRDLYAAGSSAKDRIIELIDDDYLGILSGAVAGRLGGKVGVAPRLFLPKLVDVLDRVDEYDDFDLRRDYTLTVERAELTVVEREAAAVTLDDIDLDVR